MHRGIVFLIFSCSWIYHWIRSITKEGAEIQRVALERLRW